RPKWKGGNGVKDGRRGGSPWLHKRGFGSAGARVVPRRTPEGILDAVGASPPGFATGGRRGRKPSILRPKWSGARRHPVAWTARCPESVRRNGRWNQA